MSDAKDKSADITEDRDEGFLSRWSRRKLESEETDVGDPAEVAPSDALAQSPGDQAPAPVLTDEDMPPLEELGEESDYSGFLSPGVSEALRQAALRRLFSSPKFNVCDGLDDYAEDYTKFAPLGDVITADMRHHMERALKKMAEDKDAGDADTAPVLVEGSATPSDGDAVTASGGNKGVADADDVEDGDDTGRA